MHVYISLEQTQRDADLLLIFFCKLSTDIILLNHLLEHIFK